jgi:GNAT superfamily N-acetyltransferase
MTHIVFEQVQSEMQKAQAGALIREYLTGLNDRLQREYGLQFDVEAMVHSDLSDPNKFHPPYGRFYLARSKDQVVGVGCLKRLQAEVAEVQRMYVPPHHRGQGIGRALAQRLVAEARALGYRQLRLESLKFLEAAHALYHSLGFRDIPPYTDNSMAAYQSAEQLERYYSITVFMELEL